MHAVKTYAARFADVADPDALHDSLLEAVGELGFDAFIYSVLRAPAERIAVRQVWSYPDAWLSHYNENEYDLIDPVFPRAAESLLPFSWESLIRDPRTSQRQRRIFEQARDFGLRSGVSIPLHGPQYSQSVLSLAAHREPTVTEADWLELRTRLTMLGAYAHEALWRQAAASRQPVAHKLTDRERECLAWTSRGKTSWEVGEILNISEKTVLFHVNNAMRKLNVYSKHHAVVKTIMMGLIQP
jgi:DNA-binding CsgD family transcriptional regulator